MAYGKSVSFSSGATPDEMDYQIQRQQQLANLLQQGAEQPVTSLSGSQAPISWTQGLAKMLQAYQGRKAGDAVDALLKQRDQQAQSGIIDKLNALAPQQHMTIGDIPEQQGQVPLRDEPASPGFQLQNDVPIQANPVPGGHFQPQLSDTAKQLATALSGQTPEAQNSWLGQQLAQRMLPPQTGPFDLAPGAKRFDAQGNVIAENPKEITDTGNQKTDEGLTYNTHTGKFTDSAGRVLSSDEVADRHAANAAAQAAGVTTAQNKAKLALFPPGSMDYFVEWSRQNGGNIPPGMSRTPTALWAFGNAMKARAMQDGDSMAGAIADARIKQSLKPAMAQNATQISTNASFLKTMEDNIAAADGLAQKVGGATSPVLNRIFNEWKRGVTTNPEDAAAISALDRWNNSIQGEAAKIATGGVGSISASSDAQIAKAVAGLNSAQTYAGWRASADAAIQEGHNRMNELGATQKQMRDQSAGIGGGPAAPAADAQPQTGPVAPYNDPGKEARYQAWKAAHPNG